MRKYDYSFLRSLKVPANFLNMTSAIYSLKTLADQKKSQYPDIFTNLEKIAIIQSVKGSNAIEGIVTTDKRIEEIVNQNSNPLNHTEKEIAGYKDALNLIHENYQNISFDVNTIKSLHRVMLDRTELLHRGDFKKEDNVIRERYKDGTTRIRFMPVKTSDVETEMNELVYAYVDAINDSEINQLILIPCVILDFLCIHPFQDGNGRMSRLLSLLLMYKNGFDISKYVSFEEQINRMKGNYYEALRLSSIGWHENNNDYIPFIENFLYTLYLCYKELDKRFLTIKSGKVSKTKRVEETVLSSFIPISKKEIQYLLPDISITTIEKVLTNMLKEGQIIKIGNTHDAKYIKNK